MTNKNLTKPLHRPPLFSPPRSLSWTSIWNSTAFLFKKLLLPLFLISLFEGPMVFAAAADRQETAAGSPSDPLPPSALAADASNAPSPSDRLDLGNLEQKYWSAKDDDFTVVQNRTFSKSRKISLGLLSGMIINDGFIEGQPASLSLGYFFNERHGLLVDNTQFTTHPNSTIENYRQSEGAIPDYNYPVSTTSLTYLWSPIYAKVSLLEKKILYLDVMIGAHLGTSRYKVASQNGDFTESSTQYGLDVSQVWFFNKTVAFRFDIRTTWSQQNKYKYYQSGAAQPTSMGSSLLRDNVWLFGLNFYFDSFGSSAKEGGERP